MVFAARIERAAKKTSDSPTAQFDNAGCLRLLVSSWIKVPEA